MFLHSTIMTRGRLTISGCIVAVASIHEVGIVALLILWPILLLIYCVVDLPLMLIDKRAEENNIRSVDNREER